MLSITFPFPPVANDTARQTYSRKKVAYDSKAAICVMLAGKPKVRAYGNEVNVKALVAPTVCA